MTGSVIAIVDDDAYIGDMLEELLRREGYGVLRAYSGTEALMLLEDRRPDLILLDLMLPGLNGEEVLPHLTGIPVIVLSARAAVEDKVDLLQGGAADYLTKPFDTRELLARIAVQLRRQSRQDGILRYRGIALAPETREATVDGGAVRLTRTEYGILKLLMQNPRQVITKSQLLEQLSMDTPDCVESSLKVHVSNLRRKLREAGAGEVIEAVWGIGFKLAERFDAPRTAPLFSSSFVKECSVPLLRGGGGSSLILTLFLPGAHPRPSGQQDQAWHVQTGNFFKNAFSLHSVHP